MRSTAVFIAVIALLSSVGGTADETDRWSAAEQAIARVPESPTDRQFASGCSPRRFGPTQLPSATELWLPPARTFTVLIWRLHGRTHLPPLR